MTRVLAVVFFAVTLMMPGLSQAVEPVDFAVTRPKTFQSVYPSPV